MRGLEDFMHSVPQRQYLADLLKAFEKDCGNEQPHLYLYDACRTAVAHAKPRKRQAYDPDNLFELRRLHAAADVLRELARLFIQNELHVSDCAFDGS
jgi:Methylamine utilization protein MauJ